MKFNISVASLMMHPDLMARLVLKRADSGMVKIKKNMSLP
jgi:hypothetical protein